MVKATNRLWWLHPRDCLGGGHLSVPPGSCRVQLRNIRSSVAGKSAALAARIAACSALSAETLACRRSKDCWVANGGRGTSIAINAEAVMVRLRATVPGDAA